MKNSKHIITLLVLALIGSNLFWMVDKYRSNNKQRYEDTYNCELNELNYCLNTFEKGMSYSTFKKKIKKMNLVPFNTWNNNNLQYLMIQNIQLPCPESNRPYCGIRFTFENQKLTHIEVGYPCH